MQLQIRGLTAHTLEVNGDETISQIKVILQYEFYITRL